MNDVLRPLVILVLVSLSSCGSGSKPDGQPSTVVRNFLAWYKQNYAELNPLTLGKYVVTDTTVMFVVDTTRTRRYIELIRQSAYFSEVYLSSREDFFIRAKHKYEFETHVESADEFEYDYVLKTQEVNEGLVAIEKLEVISEVVSGVRSEVRVKVGTNLLFRLIRNDRSWVINEIESLGREK